MITNPYVVGGPLMKEHDATYVRRSADTDCILHLQSMDYLLVIEPRQQGKTSLINQLMGHPGLQSAAFAYVDVTTPDHSSEEQWFQTLCPRVLRQLSGVVHREHWPPIPKTCSMWRDHLWQLANHAEVSRAHLVIALDEIGAIAFPGATEFFSVLRDVYNSRQAEPEFRRLTFLLCGAFHPRDLIKDDKISPFNIAQRVRLEDFTLLQVQELVKKVPWTPEQIIALSERIHYWTEGQPYLTQLLCTYLRSDATAVDVDVGVERLRREDENHLPPILERLYRDDKLRKYVDEIGAGKRVRFYPREHPRQAQLELLGVLKADQEGYCRIRNRIYKLVLHPHDNPTFALPVPKIEHGIGMDLPHDLIEQLQKGNVVLFCGAGVSVSDGGIPSGGQLARELAIRAGLVDAQNLTLPDVAQAFELEIGHQSLIAFITERIEGAGRVPLRTHQLIATPPFKRIITTNWDTLLEEAFRQAGRPFLKIVRDEDVAYVDEGKITLIKLHGCIDQKDTIVVTGDDYYDVFARLPETASLVRGFFATKTLLFLGYGLADEDFKRMYHEVERHLGKHKRRAYAVQLNPTALAVKYWQQKNVEVIAADATAFLEALRFAVDASSQVPLTAAGASRPESTTSSPGWTVEFAEAISSREHFEETLAPRLPAEGFSLNSNMVVGASATLFAQWLGEHTRYVFGRVFPTEKGRYVLQGARPSLSFDTSTILTMDAHWVTSGKDEETEQAWPVSSLITFKIIPLGAERIELQAQCIQPAVSSYFRQLLQEIRDRWTVRELGQTGNSEPPRSKTDTTTTGVPKPRSLNKDTNMDFERGLNAFRELAQGQDWYQDFIVHEAALRDNLRDERRYGPSEQTRRDRARIVDQLNALALTQLGASFNDLCMEKHAIPQPKTPSSDPEVVERLRRIEEKIDQGRAEDRESAEKILDALAQNRVAQADANKMMADLQTWAQCIQQAGLPLSPELRAAMDALTEHSGSAYQYLQVALPIIPGILTYNVELGSQHQAVLKALWERMKARFVQ